MIKNAHCNFCSVILRTIAAFRNDNLVVMARGYLQGYNFFTFPPDADVDKMLRQGHLSTYWQLWYMDVPETCKCKKL